MHFTKTYQSDEAALLASASRVPLNEAWYDNEIKEAAEKLSAKNNPMIEIVNTVEDGSGGRKGPETGAKSACSQKRFLRLTYALIFGKLISAANEFPGFVPVKTQPAF